MHTVLVLGGYGFFGQRISAALAHEPGVRLLIAGRRLDQAQATAHALGLPHDQGVALDATQAGFADALARLGVGTLIHTAGPFQGQDHAVARAAIQAGCNYIDLADGRDFVCGITALHEEALARGISVISGASSVPALSCAAVDQHVKAFSRLDHIRSGIGSGARAPGLATVRGIFGYCGKPLRRLENGSWITTYGWMDLRMHRFPAPVGMRLMGACDVPDLTLFPKRYPTVKSVSFHAGFASSLGHLVVYALSVLTRWNLLPGVALFARPLNTLSRWIEPLVSDKGGMFVTLEGLGHDDQPLLKTWSLVAAQNHGPHIPCGAAIALARKLARGDAIPKGAMPCLGLLTVAEYLEPLRDLDVREIPA